MSWTRQYICIKVLTFLSKDKLKSKHFISRSARKYRIQHNFSKNFPGVIPEFSWREGQSPPCTHPQQGRAGGAGASVSASPSGAPLPISKYATDIDMKQNFQITTTVCYKEIAWHLTGKLITSDKNTNPLLLLCG